MLVQWSPVNNFLKKFLFILKCCWIPKLVNKTPYSNIQTIRLNETCAGQILNILILLFLRNNFIEISLNLKRGFIEHLHCLYKFQERGTIIKLSHYMLYSFKLIISSFFSQVQIWDRFGFKFFYRMSEKNFAGNKFRYICRIKVSMEALYFS